MASSNSLMYMVVGGCMREKGGVTKKKDKVKTKLLTRIHTRQKEGFSRCPSPNLFLIPPVPRLVSPATHSLTLLPFFLCQPIGHTRYPSLRQSGVVTPVHVFLYSVPLCLSVHADFHVFFLYGMRVMCVCLPSFFIHSPDFFLSSSTTDSSHSSSINQAWPGGTKLGLLIFLASFESIKRSWAFADTFSGAKQSLRGSQSA